MILVPGATGHLGSSAVSHLLINAAANNIVAFARYENKANHLKGKGIEVRMETIETKDLETLLGRKPASVKEGLKEVFNL